MGSEPTHNPTVPNHVAIIMDGNGRWAASRGLPRLAGHERGTENIRRITEAAANAGVRYLTLWAFSTENWRRPREEVEGIIHLLGRALENETAELHRQGAQLRHIGSLESLDPILRRSIQDAIELTRDNDRLVLTLAFDYGGRQELLAAIQAIVASGVAARDVTEAMIDQYLFTAGTPDPDLVIRTSGEHRMSNFLLWQAAYAELHFSPVYWPDFGPAELQHALDDYAGRERRFGKISGQSATELIGQSSRS